MSGATGLHVAREDGVLVLTLDRPGSRNALSPALADALTAALREAQQDDAVRAVVLAGAGGDFCAGGDLKVMADASPRTAEQRLAGMQRYRTLTETLLGLDKPLVAAVDGVAFGAGLSLALTADIVVLSRRARLAMAFHRVGLVPDLGAWYTLPRVVGLQRAKELIFSAREFGADEARQMGLALEVLAPAALLPRALAIAQSFGGASPVALRLSKRALQASLQSGLGAMLDLEVLSNPVVAASDYVAEAVRRFAHKEPAQFQWPASPSANDP